MIHVKQKRWRTAAIQTGDALRTQKGIASWIAVALPRFTHPNGILMNSPMKSSLAVVALVFTVTQYLRAAELYVSPSGSDSNPGTISQPFATPQKAFSVMASGDTIYLRGGTYNLSAQLKTAIAGTSATTGDVLFTWSG